MNGKQQLNSIYGKIATKKNKFYSVNVLLEQSKKEVLFIMNLTNFNYLDTDSIRKREVNKNGE